MTHPSQHHQAGAPAPRPQTVEVWVAVLEFARPRHEKPFLIEEVQDVVGRLREWYPSGLWSSDRYAVQLQVPAPTPHQAVHWAFAYHREAVRAIGLDPGSLARVEVFSVDELERSWEDQEPGLDRVPPLVPVGLLCDEVYTATRKLLAATTPDELAAAVADFVTGTGGWVEPGPPNPCLGTIAVDISIEGDQTWHAGADALSVAGLVIEQALPALLDDARLALHRLRSDISKG